MLLPKIRKLHHKVREILLPLLFITAYGLIAYAPFIPFFGLYGDDWFFTYVGHFFGPIGLFESKVMERPVLGYLLAAYDLSLGSNIYLWHIIMLITTLSGGYLLFFTLRVIWPKNYFLITTLTLLFLLYPGYLQQPSAVAYLGINHTLMIWITSLLLSLLASSSQQKLKAFLLNLVAVLLQIISFLFLEYFVGLELFRISLIIYILSTSKVITLKLSLPEAKKTLMHLTPYLAGLLFFILWRVLVFKSTRDTTSLEWINSNYFSNPTWLLTRPIELILSFLSTVLAPYFIPFAIRFLRIPLESTVISLGIGILSAILFFLYNSSQQIKDTNKNKQSIGKSLFIIGTISIAGALSIIVISGRYVRPFITFDRYTVTSVIAASFIILGFLLWKIPHRFTNFGLSLLIGISITTHLMNGYFHSLNWYQQRDIWWQLYWRAPRIENNTMMIIDFPQLTVNTFFKRISNLLQWNRLYWVDYQIYAPANLLYNFYSLNANTLKGDYLADKDILSRVKNKINDSPNDLYGIYINGFEDRRYYSQSLIITTPNDQTCLRILNPTTEEIPNNSTELISNSLPYSDLSRIIADNPSLPPRQIFGPEPKRQWCYYFQKADLARQFKSWDKLDLLKKEVAYKNLTPNDANEWLPFIEGSLIKKQFQDAEELINRSLQNKSAYFSDNLCRMFLRLQKDNPSSDIAALENNYCP